MFKKVDNSERILTIFLILVGVGGLILLIVGKSTHTDALFLVVIMGLIGTVTISGFRSAKDLHRIKTWLNAVEPSILSASFGESNITNETAFYELLVQLVSNNKEVLKSMIRGKFVLSSDVFIDYWVPLLNKNEVKYYHSTAIIKNENYFEANQLEKMVNNNISLSNYKKIILLFFVAENIIEDNIKKQQIAHIKHEIESKGKNSNIKIRVAKLEILGITKVQDFGIAGDLAYAVLNQDPADGKQKYFLDFQKDSLGSYQNLFNFQLETIKIQGEVDLSIN